jgi:arylsulfatase A-like enzyme
MDDLLLGSPDIMPTLLSLMGLAGDIPAAVEGSDYADAFLGKPCDRPPSAFYFLSGPQFSNRPERRGVRTDRYTFVVVRHQDRDEFILHDNFKDPYQLKDVATQQPEVAHRLTRELNWWLQKMEDSWQPVR